MDRKIYKIKEYLFMAVVTIASLIALSLSFQIFMDKPRADSAGTFPIFASGLMVICCIMVIFKIKSEAEIIPNEEENQQNLKEIIVEVIKNEIPIDVIIMIIFVIVYGFLIDKIGFYITTGAFLIGSMCYIGRGRVKRAILATGISLITIWLIIDCIFKVALP